MAEELGGSLLRPDLKNYKAASNLGFNEVIQNRINNGEKLYHMAFGQSPFPVYDKAVDALKEHAGENAYLPVAGIKQLREAIASFHQRVDDIQGLSCEDIIVGSGTKQLSFLLFAIFGGDIYLPSPSWTTYKPQAILAHHNPIIIDTKAENKWKVNPADLDAIFTSNAARNKLLVLINPDNPSGTTYTADENEAIATICRKHKAVVLCDDIYSLLHFEKGHDSFFKHYSEATILQNGLSKWASAGGWRLGYQIFPPCLAKLKDAIRSSGSHTYSCASAPVQYAALEYFKYDAECENYVNHCRRILKALSEVVYRELTSVGVKIVQPMGGFYMMPDFECLRAVLKKRGISTGNQMSAALLEETGVALLACGPEFLRPENELTFRLCFINFDGRVALEASRNLGLATTLTESFVEVNCSNTLQGVGILKQWVLDQLKTA